MDKTVIEAVFYIIHLLNEMF